MESPIAQAIQKKQFHAKMALLCVRTASMWLYLAIKWVRFGFVFCAKMSLEVLYRIDR